MSMASIETMTTSKDVSSQDKMINVNLISLKCLAFLFFGAMGCLFPFLPLHMIRVGLTLEQVRLISIISPVIGILGPLIVAPIADKLATSGGEAHMQSNKPFTGRYLRIMIAITCLLSATFYLLLLSIPIVERIQLPKELRPTLKFACDQGGAIIYQERNREHLACYNWTSQSQICSILLKNCHYECSPSIGNARRWGSSTLKPDLNFDGSGDLSVKPIDLTTEEIEWRTKAPAVKAQKYRRFISIERFLPHLCFGNMCHVYTSNSGSLAINATFQVADNADEKDDWCSYPIAQSHCRIPENLTKNSKNETCSVECDLLDPTMSQGSGNAENQCSQVAGDPKKTFWMYLIIRSMADIFPTAAVTLINSAMVIATRETSCGRGDVGRQLAFGSLGFTMFGSISGYLNSLYSQGTPPAYLLPLILHGVLMLLASIVAVCANGMPLSPPEWWWHTRSGMVAVPMSAIKRYGSETAALVFVLTILGTFWSVMDSYLPLYLHNLHADSLTIAIILTIGALPATFFLWKSENFVDYCGHSNLLIIAFTMYIVRFIGLSLIDEPWWALLAEAFELFTLGVMWITAILYMRHLIPRNMTVTAQALPVIAHFCVGRCLGALIGAYIDLDPNSNVNSLKYVYRCMAVTSAIIAVLYFILYHGFLKPRCHAQTAHNSRHAPSILQGMNGNGHYTPLRVYHNEMGRKGQFRY